MQWNIILYTISDNSERLMFVLAVVINLRNKIIFVLNASVFSSRLCFE